MVGFSWERSFDSAVHTIATRLGLMLTDSTAADCASRCLYVIAMCKLGLALTVVN